MIAKNINQYFNDNFSVGIGTIMQYTYYYAIMGYLILPKIFRRKYITLTRNRVIRICIQNTLVPPIAGYF